MNRRQIFRLLTTSLRSSSTSSGLRGQQQPTKAVPTTHQYPKMDPHALMAGDLDAMFGEIHQELNEELKSDLELGDMAK